MESSAAYQHCEDVVRTRARNFAYGIRLLPTAKRQALSAVYAFARRIDDIGDGPESDETRLAQLGAEADRARDWYDSGLRLLPLLDRRSAACTSAMAGIYSRLLARIAADPITALNTRMSLPPWEKAVVAGRALAGARP